MFSLSTRESIKQGNCEHLALQPKGPIRSLLRHATAPAHARVDRHFGALIAAGRYGAFLAASAATVIPLEAALTDAGAERLLPDWPARRRTAALRADLESLEASPAPEAPPIEVGGEAHQFGILYVLEGSRLGASVLLAGIEVSSDPHIRHATRYLRHGEGQRFWPSFLERLEGSPAVARAPHEAVAGAQAAFGLFVPRYSSVPPAEVAALEVRDGA